VLCQPWTRQLDGQGRQQLGNDHELDENEGAWVVWLTEGFPGSRRGAGRGKVASTSRPASVNGTVTGLLRRLWLQDEVRQDAVGSVMVDSAG